MPKQTDAQIRAWIKKARAFRVHQDAAGEFERHSRGSYWDEFEYGIPRSGSVSRMSIGVYRGQGSLSTGQTASTRTITMRQTEKESCILSIAA